jgi:eukaryotic-like serine/threonine-protein kinase
MANAAPGNPSADRNMLFGLLAVQMDFISRDQLIAALKARALARHRALADILQEQGALKPGRRLLLDAMTNEHLDAHAGDVRRSLASVSVPTEVRAELETITDAQLAQSVSVIPEAASATAAADHLVADGVRYEVLRPHARGGLGQVSLARDAELGRQVALKELHAENADDADSRDRFVREAEVTGGLEHPGIVPVYGLGRYADGRPYYAMRFIHGETLQEAIKKLHAGDPGCTLRGLLARFVAVCNAVAYAHNRGVIHRDIKPANVMLGPYGETLIVDWGLAKVIGRGTEPTSEEPTQGPLQIRSGDGMATRAGSLLGTPQYMSPEQARREVDRLGPQSDIFSLGATLYTVLTGRPPVQSNDPLQTLQKVWNGDWPAPRHVSPSVPPPLDAVCCRAMALRPEDRYHSALALAADVERWLADEPVGAYREPALDRLRRWGRRHRPWVASAAVLLVTVTIALVFGLVAVNQEKNRTLAEQQRTQAALEAEEEQRRLAEANEQKALAAADAEKNAKETAQTREGETRSVLNFVENRILKAARPTGRSGGLGPDVTLAKALQASLPSVDESFSTQPLIEAKLRLTLGTSFIYLGHSDIAAEQFAKARALYSKNLGPDDPETLKCTNNLANTYLNLGRNAEGLKLFEENLALRKAKLGPDNRLTLTAMGNLAGTYRVMGRYADAMKLHEEALAIMKGKLGPDDRDTLWNMCNLAICYAVLGRSHDARKLFEETLAGQKAKLGADNPDTLQTMNGLANVCSELGEHARALELREETLALRKAKLGPDHPETLTSMNNLAESYSALGRHADAQKLFEQTLALKKAKFGPNHPDVLFTANSLANSLSVLGQHARAIELHEDTLARRKATLGPDHPETLTSMHDLAECYAAAGRYADSVKLQEETLALRRAKLGVDHPDTLVSMYSLACCQALMVPGAADRVKQADVAMDFLRKAVAAGYCNTRRMKKDTDLDALREREDFRKLLADAEAKVQKAEK